ncbi:MAG TPA: Na+/glucose cotransporter [Bacteroides sp.]|nr:Na+/glucose cotransporter [Bacteroides sp.]
MDIYKQLTSLDLVVMILYVVVLVALGSWISFKKRKSGEHLFLAQHSLGWPSIGFTMWGTNVGPSMLIASASIGYTTGIVGGNFSWYAFVFIFLLAIVFSPHYLRMKISTLPEFVGERFNDTTRELLTWYFVVTILLSWLALTLYAGGLLVSQIMHWPLWLSVSSLVAISAFFTVSGGLKTVANTNIFQMSLLIIASSVLTITGLVEAGGIRNLISGVDESYWKLFLPADNPEYPWFAILLGYPVMGVWFWCTDQSMVQSVLGAKNLTQGQLGANFTGWLKILDVPLFILPGIICLVLFPNLSDPTEAYMTMVSKLLPPGMVGLIVTVLMAALISTIASALNSLSTLLMLDIYVKRIKPESTQKEIIFKGRITTLAGAVISVLLALAIASMRDLDLFSFFQAILGFLAPPVTTVFVVGILWRKATARAANFVLAAGTIISLAIGFCFLNNIPEADFWPHFLFLSFLIFLGLTALMIIISILTRSEGEVSGIPSLQEAYRSHLKVEPVVKWVWGLLIAVMIVLYILFN